MRDAVFGLLGLWLLVSAWRLGIGSLREPGPGFMPLLAGAGLVAVAAFDFVRSRLSAAGTRAKPGIGRQPLLMLLALAGYVALLERAGYIVSTLLLSAAVLVLMDMRSAWRIGVISAFAAGASYVLFHVLLGVRLPAGPFHL